MCPLPNPSRFRDAETDLDERRRRLLTLGASVGATMVAGCASRSPDGSEPTTDGAPTDDSSTDGSTEAGTDSTASERNFRLLISDQPVAIDEFDELNVSFDRARIFRGGGTDADATQTAATSTVTTTANATATAAANATETTAAGTVTDAEDDGEADDGEGGEDSDAEGGADGDQRGFSVIDLGGKTVDLTRVVGDRAVSVFDGALPTGRYTKVELHAADVEGIVDGDAVDVMIPSGKLQIVKPFEVVAGETVSFVFDINVVRKGNGGYNLLPVISESGVAGEDVAVEEVGDGSADDDATESEASETEETEGESETDDGSDAGNGQGQGPPGDA